MAESPSSPGRLPPRYAPAVRSALLLIILAGAAPARVVAQVREAPPDSGRVRIVPSKLQTRVQPSSSPDTPAIVRRITVPDVTGLMLSEATDRLAAAGLKVGPVDSVQTTAPPGSVVKQWPEPGSDVSVRPTGRYLARLWLATASPQASVEEPLVPDLSGRTVAEARRTLEAAHLRVGKVAEIPGTAPAGTVVGQGPAAGTRWQVGSGVDLEVGAVTDILVPDLVGKTPAEATAALAGLPLTVGQVDSVATPSGTGTVVSQTPAPGTRVPPGSAIALVRGVAPSRAAWVIVPDLAGDSVGLARQRLESMGLRLAIMPGGRGARVAGRVRAQRPLAGDSAARGSVIEVELESAPAGTPSGAGRPLVLVLSLAAVVLLVAGGARLWKRMQSRSGSPQAETAPELTPTGQPPLAGQHLKSAKSPESEKHAEPPKRSGSGKEPVPKSPGVVQLASAANEPELPESPRAGQLASAGKQPEPEKLAGAGMPGKPPERADAEKPPGAVRAGKPPKPEKRPKPEKPRPSPQGPTVDLSVVWDLGHTELECGGPLEAAPAIHLVAHADLEGDEVTLEHAGSLALSVRTGGFSTEELGAAAALEGRGVTFLHRPRFAARVGTADAGTDGTGSTPTGGEHE